MRKWGENVMELTFSASLDHFRTHNFAASRVLSRLLSCPCFLGCAVDGHPMPNITWFYSGEPLSLHHRLLAAGRILQILNISDAPHGEFSCLAQNEAGSLTQKTSLAIQGNSPVSVLLPCEALTADYPALPFSSWISPLWNQDCCVQEEIGVLMFYCHGDRFAGLPGTLSCFRFYFIKKTPDISGLLSIQHTLLIQVMLIKSRQFSCPEIQDRGITVWTPKIRSPSAGGLEQNMQLSLHQWSGKDWRI